LEILKRKVNELREYDKKALEARLALRDLGDDFVEEFKNNKVELHKAVSWIGDAYKNGELASILEKTAGGKEFDKKSLDAELAKVPLRLGWGLQSPKLYSDDRVSRLVDVLNVYDNYIDTFESIELSDDSNCLDQNRYLISHDLHNILMNGYKITRDRTIAKEQKGVYLVMFKSIKLKGKDVLIYKYIKYPYIFYDCLYSYILRESSSLVITNDKSVGVDYIFVMENIVLSRDDIISEINRISDLFKHKSLYGNTRGIFPRNPVDLFKMLLKGCPVFANKMLISGFIKSCLERNTLDVVTKLVNVYGFYSGDDEGINMLKDRLDKQNFNNYNLLSRVVFITEDLDSLINGLK